MFRIFIIGWPAHFSEQVSTNLCFMKFFPNKVTNKHHFADLPGKIEYNIFFYGYEPPGVEIEKYIGKERKDILEKYRGNKVESYYEKMSNETNVTIYLVDAHICFAFNAKTDLCVDAFLFKDSEEGYLELVGNDIYLN